MGAIRTIAARELRSYFATPLAYVFIVIFLALAGLFTFYLGGFYERGQAECRPSRCGCGPKNARAAASSC